MRKYIIYFTIFVSCFSESIFQKYYREDFEKEKIEGAWFEIAKVINKYVEPWDHSVTTYTFSNDKEFVIETKGYDNKKKKYQTIKGVGKVKKDGSNIIEAKFFGILKRDYIVLDYDKKDYLYMVVRGQDSEAFWILSRSPYLDRKILEKLIKIGEETGIKKEELFYVKQK